MDGIRYRARAFTLIEVVTVIAILAVITTIASVALGKMFTMTSESRSAAVNEQSVRSALIELSRDLHSSASVECRADTLIYEYNGRPGEPFQPSSRCTVRLVESSDPQQPSILVRETRSELRGKEQAGLVEELIPNVLGFKVRCLTDRGWTSQAGRGVDVVSLSVWTGGQRVGRDVRVYSTAVNVPRTLWQGRTSAREERGNV